MGFMEMLKQFRVFFQTTKMCMSLKMSEKIHGVIKNTNYKEVSLNITSV